MCRVAINCKQLTNIGVQPVAKSVIFRSSIYAVQLVPKGGCTDNLYRLQNRFLVVLLRSNAPNPPLVLHRRINIFLLGSANRFLANLPTE